MSPTSKAQSTITAVGLQDLIAKVRKANHVYIIGNGGSYANAQHLCNDLLAKKKRAFVLDAASLTATANDFGYADVFARWIEAVGQRGDLLLALSGSGTSENIRKAMRAASKRGMMTHLLTDYLRDFDMQESEEIQLRFGHAIWRSL